MKKLSASGNLQKERCGIVENFFQKKEKFFILKLSKIKNKNLAKTKNTKNHLKKRKKLKKK